MPVEPDSLAGIRILVTRPVMQSDKLLKMIRARGGTPITYPLFDIQPVEPSPALDGIAAQLDQYRYIIFISTNAVQFGLPLIKSRIEANSDKLLAIGRTTAGALIDAGFKHVDFPRERADTEGLLELPGLQACAASGKRILIIRGVGGRELLAHRLRAAGARVDYAEVYRRVPTWYDPDKEIEFWQSARPDIVILTSNSAVDEFVRRVPEKHREAVLNVPAVVMSTRVAEHARALGFSHDLISVDEADDAGIINKCEVLAGSQAR